MKTKEELLQMLEVDVDVLRKEFSGDKYSRLEVFSHLMSAYSLLLHYQDLRKEVSHGKE